MAMVQADAQRFAIASRVSRIEALNDEWLRVREYQQKRKGPPRTDLSYALIALQSEARKEIEGDVHRVEFGGRLEITEAIRVVRFVEQDPRKDELPQSEVVEAE